MNRPTRGRARAFSEAGAVAVATVACLLPFANKALHIDDHRYVQMAQQIQRDPFDFYGFEVNLGGSFQPEAAIANNPPGVAFYTALVAPLFGWSETGLHLAFLLPALATTLGTFALALALCRDARLAGLACLATPVFLVSATTLMADVAMTGLFCGAVACWVHGLAGQRRALLLLAGVLATLCALSKYFGIALIPLLLAYAALRERRLGAWVAPLLLPVAALVAFEAYTAHVYGVSAISSAASWAVTTRTQETGALERVLVGTLFAGGLLAPALGFAAVGFTRRMGIASLALGGALLAAALLRGRLAGLPLVGSGADANLWLHLAVFALAAATLAVLVGADLARRRDAEAVLLALWCLGTFVFATIVNYTTNARTLLPLAPPVAILLVRRLDARGVGAGLRYAPLVPALALSLAVAWGDSALANASRSAARQLAASYAARPGTLWFEGGWGLQHYLGAAGGRLVDVRRNVLRPGDLLVGSDNLKRPLELGERAASVVGTLELPLPPISTMLLGTGTGFYAIQWGPLPYRFLPGARERFTVRRLEQFQIFETDPARIEQRTRELERAARVQAPLLALARLGFPVAAASGDGSSEADLAGWARCTPALAELGRRLPRGCGWCASEQQCTRCVEEQAGAAGLGDDCRARLGAALARVGSECAAALAQGGAPPAPGLAPVCRELGSVYRSLLGGA